MWSLCDPHSTIAGVNSVREYEMRFICPKHSLKTVVLLFHFIECQIRKILTRVEVRRFQFFVLLQFAGILFQGYSLCFPDTSVRHFCLPRNFSSTAVFICRNGRHGLHCLPHYHGNSSGFREASTSWTWHQIFFMILFNTEDTIGFLPFAYCSWSDMLAMPQWYFPNSYNAV